MENVQDSCPSTAERLFSRSLRSSSRWATTFQGGSCTQSSTGYLSVGAAYFLVGDSDESLTPPHPLLPVEISPSADDAGRWESAICRARQRERCRCLPNSPTAHSRTLCEGEVELKDLINAMDDRASAFGGRWPAEAGAVTAGVPVTTLAPYRDFSYAGTLRAEATTVRATIAGRSGTAAPEVEGAGARRGRLRSGRNAVESALRRLYEGSTV